MLQFRLFLFSSLFSFFMIFFKEFEDRQFKLHASIKLFWFLILATLFNWGDQNNHKQNVNNVEWFHFQSNKPALSFLFPKHIFRKKNQRIQHTNTKLKLSNNAIVNRLSCDSLSLWRKVFLLVVEALHYSGCFSACRDAHFPVCEEDHRTGLALCLAFFSM